MTFRQILLFSLLSMSLFAENYGILQFESTLHYENEKVFGHDIVIPGVLKKTYGDEHQNLATFFAVLAYRYLDEDDIFSINLEGRANYKLSKKEYQTPIYIDKYNLDELDQAMVTVASIDLYSRYASVTLGRNNVHMDWLNGNIDTVMLYHEDSYLSARAFWFYNYYDFQVNYISKVEDVNDGRGIYGLYLQSGERFESFELGLYYYLMQSVRNIGGAKLSLYPTEQLTLNGSYSFSNDLRDGHSYNEEYLRFWAQYLFNQYNEISMGISITGKKGLFAMLQFGSHPFSEFYLGNEIARPKAKNYYAAYDYIDDRIYLLGICGFTEYYDDIIENRRLKKAWMRSWEADLTAGVFMGEYLTFELSYMYKDVDSRDFLEFDQQLVMVNLTVAWP